MIHDLCQMFPAGYATPHRGIFLTLLARRTGRAGYLLRYPADLRQPGQGGPDSTSAMSYSATMSSSSPSSGTSLPA